VAATSDTGVAPALRLLRGSTVALGWPGSEDLPRAGRCASGNERPGRRQPGAAL